MKKNSFLFAICLFTFLTGCRKEINIGEDEEIPNTPLPGQPTYCRIESIWENPGAADQRYFLVLYDQFENPTAITTPFPSTGHPFRQFKYDQWHRLREYLGDNGNGFFELWHFYGFDLNGRIGVDTMYTFGKLLDKPTDYFERIISQIQYDNQGRIIHVSKISSHGVSSVDAYEYDAAGNLVYPFGIAVTYDNKVNVHRTNDIWMFLARDYSMNNPLIADAYNPTTFPTTFNSNAPDRGPWTNPVHLGSEVNSPGAELGAALSPDELSLYFNSDRTGSVDIYVSHRACLECMWQQAQNLGPTVNGPGVDGNPALSPDGHLLFFLSDRGLGNEDLWVSHRQNPSDDFGWEAPVNLGPLVNSPDAEGSPSFVTTTSDHAELYFSRNLRTWVAPVSPQGVVLGPAVQVDLGGEARGPSVRKDGRELLFWADASRGGVGRSDIWVSTRRTITDPWSTPVNIGAPVNTAVADLEEGISADGNTLVFSGAALRGGLSFGLNDIWITTRKQYFSFANTDIYLSHSQIGYGCRQSYW
jgi:hypothetical protein